jgi:hypothetical protein
VELGKEIDQSDLEWLVEFKEILGNMGETEVVYPDRRIALTVKSLKAMDIYPLVNRKRMEDYWWCNDVIDSVAVMLLRREDRKQLHLPHAPRKYVAVSNVAYFLVDGFIKKNTSDVQRIVDNYNIRIWEYAGGLLFPCNINNSHWVWFFIIADGETVTVQGVNSLSSSLKPYAGAFFQWIKLEARYVNRQVSDLHLIYEDVTSGRFQDNDVDCGHQYALYVRRHAIDYLSR